jgi:hypothetical protein
MLATVSTGLQLALPQDDSQLCWPPLMLSASVAEYDIADVRPLFGQGRA